MILLYLVLINSLVLDALTELLQLLHNTGFYILEQLHVVMHVLLGLLVLWLLLPLLPSGHSVGLFYNTLIHGFLIYILISHISIPLLPFPFCLFLISMVIDSLEA